MTCAHQPCSLRFTPKPGRRQRYCCEACRRHAHRKAQRTARATARRAVCDVPRPKHVRRKRLECKWCGMGHRTDLCPRNRNVVKQYGTVDAQGNYVPPPGVKVRVLEISRTVHSDTLRRVLGEMGR